MNLRIDQNETWLDFYSMIILMKLVAAQCGLGPSSSSDASRASLATDKTICNVLFSTKDQDSLMLTPLLFSR